MIPRLLLIVSMLMTAEFARADDEQFPILKVQSEVYTNVTVTSVTATHIYFMHSRGLGDAKLQDLDPALQKLFNFNSTNAAAAALQSAQANARYREAVTTNSAATVAAQRAAASDAASRAAAPQAALDGIVPPHKIYAKSFLNQYAPDIKVETWLTSQPDTQGKFVLVDFWATWCGPCRRSIPHLNTLYGTFRDRLVVIGVSDETPQDVRKMRDPRIDYYVGVDTQQRTSSVLGITGIPHAILIDPKGIVRFEGMPDYLDENNLAALIAKYSR